MIINEIKSKIFAPYILSAKYSHNDMLYDFNWFELAQMMLPYPSIPISDCSLILKPLSSISDEDAIEVAKIEGMKKFKIYRDKKDIGDLVLRITEDKCKLFLNDTYLDVSKEWKECHYSIPIDDEPYSWSTILSINSFQYLQSKGYALPYMQYSVKDLAKEGIYKLID